MSLRRNAMCYKRRRIGLRSKPPFPGLTDCICGGHAAIVKELYGASTAFHVQCLSCGRKGRINWYHPLPAAFTIEEAEQLARDNWNSEIAKLANTGNP
jgi:hypothetical protein